MYKEFIENIQKLLDQCFCPHKYIPTFYHELDGTIFGIFYKCSICEHVHYTSIPE